MNIQYLESKNEFDQPDALISLERDEVAILMSRVADLSQRRILTYDEACIMRELFDAKAFMQTSSYWDNRVAKAVEKLLSPKWYT